MSERRLVVMGSGETTPTMVSTHQRLLSALGPDADAVLFDTPYGFQENAAEITERALAYFRRNVGHEVRAVELRRPDHAPPTALEAARRAVRTAGWVFAGPGSPSYLLHQWRATDLPAAFADRLRTGTGTTVFASAAAVTLGSHAIPVYEIYKVGADPHWLPGLDLLAPLGLPLVVIPHYDNAEGGTHDTRFCYLGERRLRQLEAELPDDTAILGVDEHTAAILDLAAGTLTVEGRGGVTLRRREGSTVHPPGSTVALDDMLAGTGATAGRSTPAGGDADPGGSSTAAGSTTSADAAAEPSVGSTAAGAAVLPLAEQVTVLEAAFDAALTAGDATAATDAALELHAAIRAWEADTEQSDDADRAHATLRAMLARLGELAAAGLHDHRDLVAPHVDSLLELRARARAGGRYDEADRIRDELTAAGIEVRDTAQGSEWEYDGEGPRRADTSGA